MKTNILLAIDVAPEYPLRHVEEAAKMAAELVRDSRDQVIVVHIREFSVPKLARTMRDHGGTSGRGAVDQVVADLRSAGIRASGLIREADTGHVAQTILAAAAEFDARIIVLGARGRTNLPRVPFDAATHLLHLSTLPVLIVPSVADGAGRPAPANGSNVSRASPRSRNAAGPVTEPDDHLRMLGPRPGSLAGVAHVVTLDHLEQE
jgi:nucleotide-binding universal stress UspA family protein